MACVLKLLCIAGLVTLARSVCDEGWLENGLFCYYFSKHKGRFKEASDFCANVNANLLDIVDAGENEYAYSRSAEITGEPYWIGYERITGDIWRWIATEVVGSYYKWDVGEPDGEGDCARLTPYEKGSWRDGNCNTELKFICKKQGDCGEPSIMPFGATMEFSSPAINSTSGNLFYPSGTVAYYTCTDGHDYADESVTKSSSCELDGSWVPDLPMSDPCKPKKCPPPPTFDFMTMSMNMSMTELFYPFGTIVKYSCEFGYWFSLYESQVKYKTLICQDKQWRGDSINHCSRMFCARPVTENSRANTSLNQRGTVAFYRCREGYTFADNTTEKVFTCGQQTWVPPAEPCLPKECPEFPLVEGALNSTSARTFDTTLVWTCERGKQFPDTTTYKTMYCQSNEEWNQVVTVGCNNKMCTSEPTNGTETHSHNWNSSRVYQFEDEVIYTCKDDGWTFPAKEPKPTRAAKCGEDGEWVPRIIGECTGVPVVVETSREPLPATESDDALTVGFIGIIVMALLLIFIIILDLSTIGKHIAVMRDNLCAGKKREEELAQEKLTSWKDKTNAAKNPKQKTKTIIREKAKGKESSQTNKEITSYHIETEKTRNGASNSGVEQSKSAKGEDSRLSVSVYHGSNIDVKEDI